jgi:hypothetical protein
MAKEDGKTGPIPCGIGFRGIWGGLNTLRLATEQREQKSRSETCLSGESVEIPTAPRFHGWWPSGFSQENAVNYLTRSSLAVNFITGIRNIN